MKTVLENQMCLIEMKSSKEDVYKNILKERALTYEVEDLFTEDIISGLTGIDISKVKGMIEQFGLPELPKFLDAFDITKTQRRKLEMLFGFCKKLNLSKFKDKPVLNSSTKAGEYCRELMQGLAVERFVIVCLDAQNRVISSDVISEGTINEAPVYAREIVKLVLNKNANAVLLTHNHPAGSITASSADSNVTKKIQEALNTISVKVIDHIIVAEDRYTSFAEKGLL